jgi:uncharacterized protein (TIGR02466 family)
MTHEYSIVNFNPKPITIVSLKEPLFSLKMVNNLITQQYNKATEGNVSTTLFTSDYQILTNPLYKSIKDTINSVIAEYLKEILNIDNQFKMTHSWVTKNVNGAFHQSHNHPNVMLSALCYFNEDLVDEDFATLKFYGDGLNHVFKNFQFEMNITNYNIYNSSSWLIAPKLNQIIIFPAHIYHGVVSNKSEKTRYCLATNYFIEGKIGSSKHYSSLNISLGECDEKFNK